MSSTKTANVIQTIDDMLASLNEKTAAEANTEAGGYQGSTTHPIKNEDDRTEDAQEGARSQENSEDVKADQGPPAVDNTEENPKVAAVKKALGDQDKVQLNIGTNQAATGEDSQVETGSAKPGKDDDGYKEHTSHPAATDNDEIDGHKYASAINQFRQLVKQAADLGNDALATIAVESHEEIKKQAQAQLQARGKDPEKAAAAIKAAMCDDCGKDECECEAKEAGAKLADSVSTGQVGDNDKQAQAYQVVQDLGATITDAYKMADKTAEFIGGYVEALREQEALGKKAEAPEEGSDNEEPSDDSEGEASGEDSEMPQDAGGGEAPAPELGGGPAAGGGEEEALLAALLGGGGGGLEGAPLGGEVPGADAALAGMGGGMPPEAGGLPPEAGGLPPEAGGLPPEAGGLPPEAGGLPPEAGGLPPEEGGAPPQGGEDELAMLEAALAEAGIPPEALEAQAAAKAAAAIKQASGKTRKSEWRPKTAEEAKRYQATLSYIKELCGQ